MQLSASLWNVYLNSGFRVPLAEFPLWKLKLSMILCKDIADQKEHWLSWGHFIIAFWNTNEFTLQRRYFIWILPSLISFINSITQCSCSLCHKLNSILWLCKVAPVGFWHVILSLVYRMKDRWSKVGTTQSLCDVHHSAVLLKLQIQSPWLAQLWVKSK